MKKIDEILLSYTDFYRPDLGPIIRCEFVFHYLSHDVPKHFITKKSPASCYIAGDFSLKVFGPDETDPKMLKKFNLHVIGAI